MHFCKSSANLRTDKLQFKKSVYKCCEPSEEYSHSRWNYLLLLEGKSSTQSSEIAWSLLKTLSPSLITDVPAWTAYNSLLGVKPVVTTVVVLPIINGIPTEWEHLYAAMKEAKKIKNCIFKDGKIIIYFNLQLYIKAVTLQQRPDISSELVYRTWELHVVFCALNVTGKLVKGSGLGQAFDKAGKWILSEKQDIRLMTPATWLTHACLKPCLNYDISNLRVFVLDHCVYAIHFILRYDSSSQVITLRPLLLYGNLLRVRKFYFYVRLPLR